MNSPAHLHDGTVTEADRTVADADIDAVVDHHHKSIHCTTPSCSRLAAVMQVHAATRPAAPTRTPTANRTCAREAHLRPRS